MAKHEKTGKKKAKGRKAKRAEATEATGATAIRSSAAARPETGPGLPRVSPPAMLLAVGAIIAGGATALLRLRR